MKGCGVQVVVAYYHHAVHDVEVHGGHLLHHHVGPGVAALEPSKCPTSQNSCRSDSTRIDSTRIGESTSMATVAMYENRMADRHTSSLCMAAWARTWMTGSVLRFSLNSFPLRGQFK